MSKPIGTVKERRHFSVEAGNVCPQNGITLIALIITIIVMLILAGVTINIAVNGGLFKQAQNAAELTNQAAQQEQETINNIVDQMGNYVNGTGESTNNSGGNTTDESGDNSGGNTTVVEPKIILNPLYKSAVFSVSKGLTLDLKTVLVITPSPLPVGYRVEYSLQPGNTYASVSSEGIVTGLKLGTAVIKISIFDDKNNAVAEFDVVVSVM